MRLIYHPDAEAELIQAAQYYERSVSTLGIRFLDEADLSVSMILQAPDRWKILEADVRRYLMAHFPYAIYYRISFDRVRILAFKHHSRHPDYWRYRMSEK
ncbi:MAG TPA: type II toxin-antitoxin system RelE/ParE family toxin [Pyrinomonadaceae bacterium]|nr:type II toxin-antitoxin system RelE/ParE family toxin [Pyrinomonadaceae bacterium]